jgi:hypothetical protein
MILMRNVNTIYSHFRVTPPPRCEARHRLETGLPWNLISTSVF